MVPRRERRRARSSVVRCAADDVEKRRDHAAMQNAVKEITDQLLFHWQVHHHALAGHLIQFDTQVFIERNALE